MAAILIRKPQTQKYRDTHREEGQVKTEPEVLSQAKRHLGPQKLEAVRKDPPLKTSEGARRHQQPDFGL